MEKRDDSKTMYGELNLGIRRMEGTGGRWAEVELMWGVTTVFRNGFRLSWLTWF